MLGKIIRHELLLMRKDKTVWLVVLCFALAIGYAVWNRAAEIEKFKPTLKEWAAINERNIQKAKNETREIDQKIADGKYTDETPLAYNQRNPRYAPNNLTPTIPLPPAPLGVLAVGRSDLDTFAYRVSINTAPERRREQTDYPLKLLIGHLDLAFVMLYFYPLFILALSFNLISSEKESGTLALLLAQPLTLRTLILGKLAARALVIFGSTFLFSAAALLLFAKLDYADPNIMTGLFLWLSAILIYGVFWFGLALVANYRAKTSAACAFILMVAWFVLTILLPSSINLTATLIYPVPSRTEFINAQRGTSLELSQEKENITARVKQFLSEHPEFPPARRYDDPSLYWMDSAQRTVETMRRMQPVNDRFDGQLERQRRLTKFLSVASPLTIMQNLLPEIAGTGRIRYQSFLTQIDDFQVRWRKLFWTKTFFQTPMQADDYDLIPRFSLVESDSQGLVKESILPISMLLIQMILIGYCGLRFFSNRYLETK